MNTHHCLVDMDTLRNEFPDARQLSDLDRARLLAFWAEVGAAAERHGYGDRLDLVTALNHLTAFVVAGDQSLKKNQRKKRARDTVHQLRGAMNLVLRYGLFVNPETRGSA
jgi:hypothetical protein